MRAIHAKINHLMQRDGVAIIMTRDEQDTARILCEYARDMLTLRERKRVVGSREHDDATVAATACPIIALEKRPEPTIVNEVITIFSAFPDIGQTTARKCASCGITVTDFVTYSRKCPKSITRYVQKYLSDRTYDCDVCALEGIWRVSHDIACTPHICQKTRSRPRSRPRPRPRPRRWITCASMRVVSRAAQCIHYQRSRIWCNRRTCL